MLTDHALVTNAQIYGAVGLFESTLVPALADPSGKDFRFALQVNSIFNVLTLPSNCDGEPAMRHLDITATAWGFTYEFTEGLSAFYSTAITASALTPLGPAGRYYGPAFLLLGSLPYGLVAPLAGVAWPRAVREGDFSFASDYVAGLAVDAAITNISIGYVGTEGVFGSIDSPYSGLFTRAAVNERLAELAYVKAGLSNVDWMLPDRTLDQVGSTALFLRRIQWRAPIDPRQVAANQLDSARRSLGNLSVTTVHLEQWNIGEQVDIIGSAYAHPFQDLDEINLAWHDDKVYPTSGNAHPNPTRDLRSSSSVWRASLGVMKVPTMYYYGIEGGYRLRASVSYLTGRDTIPVVAQLELNSPEVMSAFPYADNHVRLQIRASFD
ncbi:MAG: hypothetical protein KF718_31495 [Polyangiaceae bacterium]|nr:hypothetical protein [Polyangiaceae bacterium]